MTTLYQVLIGRRTSSIICYAFFYDLLPYFGSFPKLREETWQKECQQLENKRKLTIDSQGYISVVASAIKQEDYYAFLPANVNFYRFGKLDGVGWRLVQFLIQRLTSVPTDENQWLENGSFYIHEVEKLIATSESIDVKDELFKELYAAFQSFPRSEANLLARTITGNMHIGETFYQVLNQDASEVEQKLIQANATHLFYQYFLQKNDLLVYQLLKDWYRMGLNQSLLVTRAYFLKGASLAEIAAKRNLKESTIRDHVIEWAVNDPNFPFDYFDFSLLKEQMDASPLPVWQQTYNEVNQRKAIDFLLFRLYQIQRKREHGITA